MSLTLLIAFFIFSFIPSFLKVRSLDNWKLGALFRASWQKTCTYIFAFHPFDSPSKWASVSSLYRWTKETQGDHIPWPGIQQVCNRGEFLAPSTTFVYTSHNWEQNPNTEGKQPPEHRESFDIWNRLEKTENCPYLSWAGFTMVTDCLIGSYVSFHFRIWSCSIVHNYLHPTWAGIWATYIPCCYVGSLLESRVAFVWH